MNKPSYDLYTIEPNVRCVICNNKGAVKSYGEWCPNGLGVKAEGISVLEEYRDKQFMNHTMGFGGTIPHRCLNCGNVGPIDFGGLEGYKMAFKTIKNGEG